MQLLLAMVALLGAGDGIDHGRSAVAGVAYLGESVEVQLPRSDIVAPPQDSVVMCIVDSASEAGLRPVRVAAEELASKRSSPVVPDSTAFFGYAADDSGLGGPWVRILGTDYEVAGAPRRLDHGALRRIGERKGVSVFVEREIDLTTLPEVVYVLTPRCEFVPYRSRAGSRH